MVYKKEELEKLIKEEKMSYEAIGRIYGVTGNSIKKAALKLGIDLEPRRKVNSKENFSHPGNSKIDKISDENFIKIIASSYGWKEIGEALGYSSTPSSNVKDNIKKRCATLGIEIHINKVSPILKKTKAELFSERKNWQSARSSIRKTAEDIYKNSGKPCVCAICGYNKHIEIAHVKAVSDFNDNALISEINDITNLVGLCPNHHWEFDNNALSEEDKEKLYGFVDCGMLEDGIQTVS